MRVIKVIGVGDLFGEVIVIWSLCVFGLRNKLLVVILFLIIVVVGSENLL